MEGQLLARMALATFPWAAGRRGRESRPVEPRWRYKSNGGRPTTGASGGPMASRSVAPINRIPRGGRALKGRSGYLEMCMMLGL